MKKMKKRARLCIALALVLVLGLGYYVYELARDGGDWAAYPGNGDVFTNGYLGKGAIYDRNGTLLMENTDTGVPYYNEDYWVRCSTLHAVGDAVGNISTGANRVFADKLVGYNFLMGTYSITGSGRHLILTIDADVCAVANAALAGRNGTVGVYNYKTGEILCMVSSPNYDPTDPPDLSAEEMNGAYYNKFLSSTFVPGSIFKVITATAAIETLDGLDSYEYTCPEVLSFGDAETDRITCPYGHGTQSFEDALANSCNCAFADITLKIGPSALEEYTKKAGITSEYSINGIKTAAGTFDFPSTDLALAWAGIGQYHDMVNPCAMMVYMGAIANDGVAVNPTLIKDVTFANGWDADFTFSPGKDRLIKESTAAVLDSMLHNDVVATYGEGNFPGLDLCAKSGTAEVGDGKTPHSWFYGYIRNEGYPYAFVVLVENGGSGAEVAGDVANQVLQVLINRDPMD